jgi:multidrug efflux pump subunit AcrA (membrane-fusion protein)
VKKWLILAAVAVVVLGAAGAAYYYGWYLPAAKADAPAETIAKVERGPIRILVASTGRVVSNLDVDIKCKASGEVAKLPFDVSDQVKKDALLVELDPVDEQRVVHQAEVSRSASTAKLESARQDLALAERTLATDRRRADSALTAADSRAKDARAKADRMKELRAKSLASQEDYDTAETAAVQAQTDLDAAKVKIEELKSQELALELKRQAVKLAEAAVEADKINLTIAQDRLTDTKVLAPMDGVVAVRNVQIGQIISSGISNVGGGTTVLTLSDLSHIFVVAAVDESDIGKVRVGQTATVTADAYPGKTFQGQVVRIATRGVNLSNVVTFEVKIEVLGDAKALLKPEMTANVEILTAAKDDAVLVPAEAVVRKGRGKQVVTVVGEGGSKEEVAVTPGLSDGTKTEIPDGLTAGQTVLVPKGGAAGKWAAGQSPGGPPPGAVFMGAGRGR